MNAIIQSLNSYVGLISFAIASLVAIFSARSMIKVNVNDKANQAQNDAIQAMQEEIASLRRKIEDAKQDNTRLKRVIDTIRIALEKRGILITISDDAVDIEHNKRSTTVRIHNEEVQGGKV
jgi:hypothetical protein